MDNREISAPLAQLLAPNETVIARVVSLALRLKPEAGLADLEGLTGLSRHSVRAGKARAPACGRIRGGPQVKIPAALLAEPDVGARAKLLYGMLQATDGARAYRGRFTYASLSRWTRFSPNTLKQAMKELQDAGWIRLVQPSRVRPIRFTLGTPALRRARAEAVVAERRLKRAQYGGEAVMQEYLTALIDSDKYADNVRPGYLVNPKTQERLELDRLYAANVAFEFNGPQHYAETGKFTRAEAEEQRLRDLIKAGLCLYQGIHLVIVHAEDLSLQGMRQKLSQSLAFPRLLPLRNLAGHEPLIETLESASLYQAAARRKAAASK